MRHLVKNSRVRVRTVLFALAIASLAQPQSFNEKSTPAADEGAWGKLELWKEHLLDEGNREVVQQIIDQRESIRSATETEALRQMLSAVAEGESTMRRILDSEYILLELGYFDLHYPLAFLRKKNYVKELQRICVGLLDLQGKFLDWLGLPAAARGSELDSQAPVRAALSELRKTFGRWSPRTYSAGSVADARERFAEPCESESSRNFADYMRRRLWIDEDTRKMELSAPEQVPMTGLNVIMAPDWQNFLGVACGFSLFDELEEFKVDGQRIADFVWYDNLPTWTYFYWYETVRGTPEHYQVVGSEYATTDVGDVWALETPGAKMDVVSDRKTGLEQHLVQHTAERFLHLNFNSSLHLAVQNGMATDMVFELYDENKERSSGSGVANRTMAFSVFIPGAPSGGGVLPAISAENRVRRAWKAKKGEGGDRFEYFLRHQLDPGRAVAKEQLGKNASKANPYYFPIFPRDDNLEKRVLYPPLFTTPKTEVRKFFGDVDYDQYAPDHRAFFRAYKVHFAAWLRTRAGASPKAKGKTARAESESAFARLLLTTARKAKEGKPTHTTSHASAAPFLESVQEIYGIPLTGEELTDPQRPNLEARCLETLQ